MGQSSRWLIAVLTTLTLQEAYGLDEKDDTGLSTACKTEFRYLVDAIGRAGSTTGEAFTEDDRISWRKIQGPKPSINGRGIVAKNRLWLRRLVTKMANDVVAYSKSGNDFQKKRFAGCVKDARSAVAKEQLPHVSLLLTTISESLPSDSPAVAGTPPSGSRLTQVSEMTSK